MSIHGLRTFVVVAAIVVGLARCGLGQEECTVRLQAPEASPWSRMKMVSQKVPLRKLMKFVDKHHLKLEKGSPPPQGAEARIDVTCEHMGDMWVSLPSRSEDESILTCWMERFLDTLNILFGKINKNPKQTPGAAPRKYMKNYCGKDLPLKSTDSDVRNRMGAKTTEMNEKLRKTIL
ncbi:hypothetical protein E2C01_064980 [Portunus trituberculatus]|uniref:Uncharacterized protein n=1 Tax=Portunus trituberculatus TaxID=210409 RepID=A0A5B7HLB4_PORTR|nr:hypothetical protein [Portunus trituberculatus]